MATTPRRGGGRLKPGIRSFDSEGAADTYTLPAGGVFPGEEREDAQCHVQVLLPKKRTVRWVGGIDPDFDVPSANLVPGLYTIRLVCANKEELRKHPDYNGGGSNRFGFKGNFCGRNDTQIPFFDPNIGKYRFGFWLWPVTEARRLQPGEFILWQARVTKDGLAILLNGQIHAEYPFNKFPTVSAIEKEMDATLRTPGTNERWRWRAILIRGYEWWADNWSGPTVGDTVKRGFKFDEPEKVRWPIPGGALDGQMHHFGGIYEKAYPLLKNYPYGKLRTRYNARWKQICGLWRMETMARGEDMQPQVHFLHVLSPVDKGVGAPESSVVETDETAALTIKTAKGRTVVIVFNKLGSKPGGRIVVAGGKRGVNRDFTDAIDLTGAQPGQMDR